MANDMSFHITYHSKCRLIREALQECVLGLMAKLVYQLLKSRHHLTFAN